jgi:hypothetical protein
MAAQFVLKLFTLVMVQQSWKTEAWDEIIHQLAPGSN